MRLPEGTDILALRLEAEATRFSRQSELDLAQAELLRTSSLRELLSAFCSAIQANNTGSGHQPCIDSVGNTVVWGTSDITIIQYLSQAKSFLDNISVANQFLAVVKGDAPPNSSRRPIREIFICRRAYNAPTFWLPPFHLAELSDALSHFSLQHFGEGSKLLTGIKCET